MYVLHATSRNGSLLTRCEVGLVDDMLPDDVLLAVFDFCSDIWQTLIHVCRRWRSLVFGSPRRLDLQLFCSAETPARDTLDIWPPLPLVVRDHYARPGRVDNIVAVLERRDRVRQIDFSDNSKSDSEIVLAAMHKPFPELTDLRLLSYGETLPTLPDSFLGGSVPRLRHLLFSHILFPGLLKLLLSAIHLVDLCVWDIPHSGYFSPETMATTLSTMASLSMLLLGFESPRSCPDLAGRRLPPPIRFALPVLTNFRFKGVYEYLEDLVSHIDAPRLVNLTITLFNDIVFDSPQLMQFITRTPMPNFFKTAIVHFEGGAANIEFSARRFGIRLNINILCKDLDWQVSSLGQVCALCLPSFSVLEDLHISEQRRRQRHWQDNVENTQWLELLHPFAAVKHLFLSEEITRRIVPVLQELVGGRATEVLPTLQNIFLERLEPSGPVQEGIGHFVATRQEVTSHLIAVSRWDRTLSERTPSFTEGTTPSLRDRRNVKIPRARQLMKILRLH